MVKSCIHFNDVKNYRCDLKIMNKDFNGRYNCLKNGKCYHYKTEEQCQREINQKKEERDRKEYFRLKKKFEGE